VDKLVPPVEGRLPSETLHVSTADAQGNVVSLTISQGMGFGSCVTVPGTGLILGHGMCRLDPRPGRANSIAPRKRPLNNACPMIVRLPERDIAVGLPGGRRIVCVVPRMVHCLIEFGATAFQAASAPRMHVEMAEPLNVQETAGQRIIEGLRAMGHEINVVKSIAGAAHIAEFLKNERTVRAGGNTWAAGVS
jgi:gamma-glutamyltranspeptidase/glutathione hydrolase